MIINQIFGLRYYQHFIKFVITMHNSHGMIFLLKNIVFITLNFFLIGASKSS